MHELSPDENPVMDMDCMICCPENAMQILLTPILEYNFVEM